MVVKWKEGDLYLLTIEGDNTSTLFSAIVLKDLTQTRTPYSDLSFAQNWDKSQFSPIIESITINFKPY
jgi:hypothetical protein